MARPCKKRRICAAPRCRRFLPDPPEQTPEVRMSLEELECIRLLDYLGMTQEECARQLGVARTTVQALYTSARRRIAGCLVEGRPLHIGGGNYELCTAKNTCCAFLQQDRMKKGCQTMKLAVTYENGQIFQHFGKTSQFKVYTIENNAVRESHILDCNGAGHSALADLLQREGIDTLICGGIGQGAQNALSAAGIRLYGGASGDTDAAVNDLLAGKLNYDPAVHCSHHAAGHTCHH